MKEAILEVENLTVRFGGLIALKGVSFSVFPGEVLGIIGPNGAGKTTLFNAITGAVIPQEGKIVFEGKDITSLPPHKRARLGIARTFQNLRLFSHLSVIDNVKLPVGSPYPAIAPPLLLPSFRKGEETLNKIALELLEKLELKQYKDRPAKVLPYGERKKLEIARALALKPKLLLLDEPAAGLSHQEAVSLMEELQRLRGEFKLTIILIEHNMRMIMGYCERIIALNYGEVIAEGTPEEVANNPAVIEAYLGEQE
ncbi:ABC transporter ATP-binding protein [bacterium]|nr:ABC transporter ATP-binding protein [bacterium]